MPLLITFAQVSNATTTAFAMPAYSTITEAGLTKRNIFFVGYASDGSNLQYAISITNAIADSGATFTMSIGATGGAGRASWPPFPPQGFACAGVGATTVTLTASGATTGTLMVWYEKA